MKTTAYRPTCMCVYVCMAACLNFHVWGTRTHAVMWHAWAHERIRAACNHVAVHAKACMHLLGMQKAWLHGWCTDTKTGMQGHACCYVACKEQGYMVGAQTNANTNTSTGMQGVDASFT
eukprot:364398-Chlamydomonas_euryale.AAC.15